MFKIIWRPKKEILKLYKQENEDLNNQIVELSTAKGVVERALDRDIVWIDKDRMSEADRLAWGNEARALLENRVFCSLVGDYKEKTNGEIVKNLIEHIAKNSPDWEDVTSVRSKIVGIELIREYAEELLIKKEEETFDTVNDAV